MKLQIKNNLKAKARSKKLLRLAYRKVSRLLKTKSLRNDIKIKSSKYCKYSVTKAKSILKFSKRNSFFTFVIIPVIILGIYYVLFASPRYESSATLSLRQNDTTPVIDSSMGALLGASTPSTSNSYLLIDYMQSTQMFSLLQKSINIQSMYSNAHIDHISKLSGNANLQDALRYYKTMISTYYDLESNSIDISAQAYNAKDAQKILQNIIKNSQQAIDYITQTLAKNRMKFSKEQLNDVKTDALKAQQNLIDFQHDKGIVDPEGSYSSKSTVVSTLQGKLAESETKLTSMKYYLEDDSSQVKALKQNIKAIKSQIQKEKSEFLDESTTDEAHAKDYISSYQWLKLNAEFKMTEYKTALQAYETSRIDALRQQSYLVEVIKPTLPDSSKYPRVLYNLLTIFILLSLIYGIGRMVVTIIIEHR